MAFSSAFGSLSSFGGTPAPSTGLSFGSPAPAPSASTFSFGAPSPVSGAPTAGYSFGPTAPGTSPSNTSFGSSAFGGFGSPSLGLGTTHAFSQQAATISGGTPYSALPPDIRQAIDKIHEAMMNHKRTVNGFRSIGPSLLIPANKPSTALVTHGSGSTTDSLPVLIKRLQGTMTQLESELRLQALADACKGEYETLYKQSVQALWTLEALANHRNVHLKAIPSDRKLQESSSQSTQAQLQEVLDMQMAHVDRFEGMPSPYLWKVLDDMKTHLSNLEKRLWMAQQQAQNSLGKGGQARISEEIYKQMHQVTRAAKFIQKLNLETDNLRNIYRFYEKGENILDKTYHKEQSRERHLDDLVRYDFVKASAASATQGQIAPAPVPAAGGFGTFTSSTTGSAPSSSFGGFGFGSPAPASNFGSATPAPALNAPTPAPPMFGSTSTTPAPAFGATPSTFGSATSSFGASTSFSSSTPRAKNKSRNKSRTGRN
jgi:hypothetical protein